MTQDLIRHTRVLEIVGDTIRVKAKDVAFGDIAVVENIVIRIPSYKIQV